MSIQVRQDHQRVDVCRCDAVLDARDGAVDLQYVQADLAEADAERDAVSGYYLQGAELPADGDRAVEHGGVRAART